MITLKINDVEVQVDTLENALGILQNHNKVKATPKKIATKAKRKRGYRCVPWSDKEVLLMLAENNSGIKHLRKIFPNRTDVAIGNMRSIVRRAINNEPVGKYNRSSYNKVREIINENVL